jgi:hypothetical protein
VGEAAFPKWSPAEAGVAAVWRHLELFSAVIPLREELSARMLSAMKQNCGQACSPLGSQFEYPAPSYRELIGRAVGSSIGGTLVVYEAIGHELKVGGTEDVKREI